jgi:hypothetical protein
MTRAFNNPVAADLTPALRARRDDWINRVRALVEQLVAWAEALGWQVERTEEQLREKLLGTYSVPGARIKLPGPRERPERALLVTPIALHVVGGDGRVDLEGYPTLSRVKLIGVSEGWKIMTDSNVPLRIPWDRDAFRQLAEDLVA